MVITPPGGVVPLLTSFMSSCCWDGSVGWLGDGISVLNANISGGWKISDYQGTGSLQVED